MDSFQNYCTRFHRRARLSWSTAPTAEQPWQPSNSIGRKDTAADRVIPSIMLSSAQALQEYEKVISWVETVTILAARDDNATHDRRTAQGLKLQQSVYALKQGLASPHTTWKKLLQQQVRNQQRTITERIHSRNPYAQQNACGALLCGLRLPCHMAVYTALNIDSSS